MTFMNSWFMFRRHVDITDINPFKDWYMDTDIHAMMSTLMGTEDKASCEEIVTLTRYAYMEKFVVKPNKSWPGKVLGKLSRRPRGNFECFLQNNDTNIHYIATNGHQHYRIRRR